MPVVDLRARFPRDVEKLLRAYGIKVDASIDLSKDPERVDVFSLRDHAFTFSVNVTFAFGMLYRIVLPNNETLVFNDRSKALVEILNQVAGHTGHEIDPSKLESRSRAIKEKRKAAAEMRRLAQVSPQGGNDQ